MDLEICVVVNAPKDSNYDKDRNVWRVKVKNIKLWLLMTESKEKT